MGIAGGDAAYITKRHWAVVLPPFLLLLFAGLETPSKGAQAWALVLLSVAWIVVSWLNFQTSEFRLTDDAFLVYPGFPWRKTITIPLDIVGTVDVYQPALGKLLDFGKVRLICKDGTRKQFKLVTSPATLMNKIYELRAALANRK